MATIVARTNREIDEGKRISALFSTLSEENKTMAIVYLSALRDKEIADSEKKKEKEKQVCTFQNFGAE